MSRHPSHINTFVREILCDETLKISLLSSLNEWLANALLAGHAAEAPLSQAARNYATALLAPDIIRAVFSVVLGRLPESAAIEHYSPIVLSPAGIEAMLADVMQSAEYRERTEIRRLTSLSLPHPSVRYEEPALVFLHIQKTAGTSLQNMLADAFQNKKIFQEHSDSLHLRSPAELSQFDMFFGHFNHDSLEYIPRRNLNTVTFVRDPSSRLISLYKFWKAHEPEHASFHDGMRLANNLCADDFFSTVVRDPHPETWNNMTWVIMGARKWSYWLDRSQRTTANPQLFAEMLEEFDEEVRAQLGRFLFVGVQENFVDSVKLLQNLLSGPELIPRYDHSLNNLLSTTSNFKSSLPEVEISPSTKEAMVELTGLDSIIYAHARRQLKALAQSIQLPEI